MATFTYTEQLDLSELDWFEWSSKGWTGTEQIHFTQGLESIEYDGDFDWWFPPGATYGLLYGTITEIREYSSGVLIGEMTDMSVDFDSSLESDWPIDSGNYLHSLRTLLQDDDTITVSEFDDYISGFAGDDTINGMGGDDWLFGSYGSDISNGGDGSDVLIDAIYTREWEAFQAYRLYRGVLDRDPDLAGHDNWTKLLYTGAISYHSAIDGFVNSAEFQAKYGGLDNEQFVILLYDNVLDREPDPHGLATWVTALNEGATRASVVQGFVDSTEFINNTQMPFMSYTTIARMSDFTPDVYRLYEATLDRQPDAHGLLYWTEDLAYGESKLSVVSGFVNSAEFKFTYGNTTNEQFVTLLYNNVLDREPEMPGYIDWVDYLNRGGSRESVVLAFADSVEFIHKTEEAVGDFMRGPIALEFSDTLNGGTGNDYVAGGLGADVFEFVAGESGQDNIYDFEAWDWISFSGFGYTNSADVLAHMTQETDGVLFDDQGQEIMIHDVAIDDFGSDSFLFA